jgi:hypothetical protein
MEKNQQLNFKNRKDETIEANFIKFYEYKNQTYIQVKANGKTRLITKKQIVNETN